MEKKTITIKEVAEHANVSQATVSRVINGNASVKSKNLEIVQRAIKELGYTPNAAAKALASNRSYTVGMLVGSLDGPFYGPLMHATEDILYKNGLLCIVTSGRESEEREQDALAFLHSKQVDGVIVHADQTSDDTLTELVSKFKTMVILNRLVPGLEQNCLYVDNELGGYLATKHLLDMGHRNIACMTGPLSKQDARDRLLGYIRALAVHGVDYDPSLTVEGRFDHEGNFDKAFNLLSNKKEVTAVFCQNDNIALAVYDACAQMNLKVAKDISLVSFDNDNMSKHLRPQLTTVGYPLNDMGKIAANMIVSQLNSSDRMNSGKLTPVLEVRDSVCKLEPK
ncbi:LacI family DNA-binding transcriptional regulator [Vibrio hippocampi]|uniref:HTH-type transcriptional regulator GalR n=1 Tax=Vibrio hippocampi TaxID=654686 RepID=A0ABN8DM07_9VIBR|nr:LacI family DNA-binding transcriptional regulator [Vibrio hippocampi]CAH0529419.1 HTH-type transcriptional regulator GalR [Vibrio hippocampi]